MSAKGWCTCGVTVGVIDPEQHTGTCHYRTLWQLAKRVSELERKLAASQGEVSFKDTRISELEAQLADRVTNARY
jgi:hypothetical protein